MKSYLSHLECSKCDKTYEANKLQQLCTCGKPLLARYDLERLKEALSPVALMAAAQLRESGWIGEDERVVVLNTGMGIKYPDVLKVELPYVEKGGSISLDHQ